MCLQWWGNADAKDLKMFPVAWSGQLSAPMLLRLLCTAQKTLGAVPFGRRQHLSLEISKPFHNWKNGSMPSSTVNNHDLFSLPAAEYRQPHIPQQLIIRFFVLLFHFSLLNNFISQIRCELFKDEGCFPSHLWLPRPAAQCGAECGVSTDTC